jgi:hypothetical protein
VFFGVFIAKDADGVGDEGSGDTTRIDAQILLDVFFNVSLISVLLMKLFSGKEQNFQSRDCCYQGPDYQDF